MEPANSTAGNDVTNDSETGVSPVNRRRGPILLT